MIEKRELDTMRVVLQQAVEWLSWPQLPGALSQRGLQYVGHFGNPRITLMVTPKSAKADGRPVITFNAAALTERFSGDDIKSLLACVERIAPVVDQWNGEGSCTFSVEIEVNGQPAQGLVKEYMKGCQRHPEESVFCDCGWFEDGYRLMARPAGWV